MIKRALHMLDELRDVVEEKPWLQIANIAGRDLERLLLDHGASAR